MHDKNSGYFTEVNYLYFDEQFARVKGLADRGLISIVQANLGRAEDAHLISEALTSSGIPVTVLDISNAWERQYAGPEGVGQFLKSVKDQLDPQARLILSSLSSSSMGHWQYFAYLVTDIFSTQLRPYFWEWFMSGGKDAPILKTAPSYWEQPSGRVRALLQGRDDISNLNAMLNLGGASEKILAMRLITINRKADAETIFNLLKILGEGDRDLQKSSLRILEYFAAKDAEHGAQVLKFALMNSRRISLESLTPMVSAAARTVRGHSAEFLAFFYEVFERGAADGDLIDAIGLADPLEQNRPLFKEKLVQLRARLAGLNTYYGNFISESQVAPRLIEKGP